MTDFRMPSLGADMTAGTVVAWHVAAGDVVSRGQIIAEVETEKGVFDVEAPADGAVADLTVAVGAKVPVGSVLAHIVAQSDERAPLSAPSTTAPPIAAPPGPSSISEAQAPSVAPADRGDGRSKAAPVLASPLARRIAKDRGLDLSRIAGTGARGAVTKEDVERALAAQPMETAKPAAAPQPEVPPEPTAAGIRQAIARAVTSSWREIPHYYLSLDVDLSAAMQWLRVHNEQRSVAERVLPAALLVRSVAVALGEFPDLNGFWIHDALQHSAAVNVAIVIARRGGGIVAPAIHDVNTLNVDALNAALRDLVQRARSGRLRGSEMSDASVTITSLGDEGVQAVFGVIYPPQVALVGFGGISNRAWASGDLLGVRPVITMTLAADHRATDGHYGSRFLAAVSRRLQDPEHI